MLGISIGSKKSKTEVIALADTGCTPHLLISKLYAEKKKLDLEELDVEPAPIVLADGHIVYAQIYSALCQIEGLENEIEIEVYVVDTEKIDEPESADFPPCIGRGFLDEYDAVFRGKGKKLNFIIQVELSSFKNQSFTF